MYWPGSTSFHAGDSAALLVDAPTASLNKPAFQEISEADPSCPLPAELFLAQQLSNSQLRSASFEKPGGLEMI